MNMTKRTVVALGVASLFAAASANAELIDFTDYTKWGPE